MGSVQLFRLDKRESRVHDLWESESPWKAEGEPGIRSRSRGTPRHRHDRVRELLLAAVMWALSAR